MDKKPETEIARQINIPMPDGDSTVMFVDTVREGPFGFRGYTVCMIHTPKRLVTAAAVCAPSDNPNPLKGAKIAFARALKQMYPNWTMQQINDREDWLKYDERNLHREVRRTIWGHFLKAIQEN